MPPVNDADIPRFWRELGLPGIADVHVHFLPRRMMDKVWAHFDLGAEHYGTEWPIAYRWSESRRLAHLRDMGVRRFTALTYPHKPDMAAWLNGWSRDFAAGVREVASSATFYPEPGAAGYVREAVEGGARVFKAHLQVGDYDPRDPMLDEVWWLLAEAGLPVVVHCGSGPTAGRFTGPGPFGEVLARHPTLVAVIAHMGMPDYADFLELAARHESVHLDTTIAFTDFAERDAPFPREMRPRLADLAHRIVLGSDYPNVPHTYAHQLAALARLDLGEDWLRTVLWDNPLRLMSPPDPA
jgi:hypothetical protein